MMQQEPGIVPICLLAPMTDTNSMSGDEDRLSPTGQTAFPAGLRLEARVGDKSLVQVSECNWHRSSTVVRLRRRSIGEDLSSFRFAYFARFAASLWASDGLE